MKRFLIILSFLVPVVNAVAQDHVFVLVDVSLSVKQADMTAAKQALQDVLLGNPLTNANVPAGLGTVQELAQSKLKIGDKLALIKFGNKATVLNNTPAPTTIQNFPGDVYQAINSTYPPYPTDTRTYLTLAKAKVAEYAKSVGLKQYKLCIISDNVSDDYGANGKPDYTDYERNLTQSYRTTSSGIIEGNSTKVQLNTSVNKDYLLEFMHSIDVSKYTLPPGSGITIATDTSAQIRINSYTGSTKARPARVKGPGLHINWSCTNCPQGAKFAVIVSGLSDNKFRPKIPPVSSQNYSLTNVPAGDYRITVSAQNFTNCDSDTVYITVDSTGGGNWLLPVVVALALLAAGYWFWNKKRQEKLDKGRVNKPQDDIFSSPKPGNTGAGGNSEYF